MDEEKKKPFISCFTVRKIENGVQEWIVSRGYLDRQCSLKSFSKQIGYNSKIVSHVINRTWGCSFPLFVRSLRISYVEYYLSQLNGGFVKISYLAHISGFSTYGRFSSAIKVSSGLSPREFVSLKANKECVQNA